ncbi:hypothetical protein MAR_035695 [Mya arenaria]|uniref:THAP-type domain-containing protein n=1 Tax=Mya arenaria TaxID=6604 RepID=A0ABY7ENG9_MYAAR|nr:hypothetical protein MAR_035695 [Mya arenaria]
MYAAVVRMPTSCSAPGCTQRFVKDSGIRFVRFPKEKERRWLLAIGRRSLKTRQHVKLWEPSAHDRLCSMHFAEAKQPKQTLARADRFKRLQRRRLGLTPNNKENCPPANDQDEISEALLMLGHDLSQSCDQGTGPGPVPIQTELDKLKTCPTQVSRVLTQSLPYLTKRLKFLCNGNQKMLL